MTEPRTPIGLEFRWAALACAVALALAPLSWPYEYYRLLRLCVTAFAVWLAVVASRSQRPGWMLIGIGFVLLYNPIVPIYLRRASWLPIDIVAAGLCGLAAFNLPRARPGT